jgi:hypothetical protein
MGMQQAEIRAEAERMIAELGAEDAGMIARQNEHMLKAGSEPRQAWAALADEIEAVTGRRWVYQTQVPAGAAPGMSAGAQRLLILCAGAWVLIGWLLLD